MWPHTDMFALLKALDRLIVLIALGVSMGMLPVTDCKMSAHLT